ncbi:MAG: FecCD family ABC transporter permease [Planctomycetota bacterium]
MNRLTPRKLLLFTITGLLGAGLVALACLFVGATRRPPAEVLSAIIGRGPGSVDTEIILGQRLPRVLLAFLVGGSLAVAGAVFQALLRNPLATPHTLGVSSGGALGAASAIFLDMQTLKVGPVGPVQFFALGGSLCAMGVIYLLARGRKTFSTLKLLLAGVTMALISSALIMFVRYLAEPHKLVVLDRWLMGGLEVTGFSGVAAVLPLMLPALALLVCQVHNLNHIAFDEELARGRGINVTAVQIACFVGGSVLTASVVSVAGPIGFVGLLVPHAFRLIFGPDHRTLLIASFFGGGAFLTIADTFARTILAPTELPVGVLTAMLGGPFFLFLLSRRSIRGDGL